LTGKVENDLVRVVAPSDTQIAPGAAVGLTLDPARLSWMDAESGAVLGKR
jgi:multiple sugar transport system ATP-binding protein